MRRGYEHVPPSISRRDEHVFALPMLWVTPAQGRRDACTSTAAGRSAVSCCHAAPCSQAWPRLPSLTLPRPHAVHAPQVCSHLDQDRRPGPEDRPRALLMDSGPSALRPSALSATLRFSTTPPSRGSSGGIAHRQRSRGTTRQSLTVNGLDDAVEGGGLVVVWHGAHTPANSCQPLRGITCTWQHGFLG